jgi:hypothetical protein
MHALDLDKTHRVIVDQTQKTWYVQNGYVYDVHGSVLGRVNDLKAFSPKWYFFCDYDCGNTYTKREQLEKHIFEDHRDLCIQRVPKPEGLIEGYFQPSEKAIQDAAKEMADAVVVEEAPFVPRETAITRSMVRRGRPPKSKADRVLATQE